MASSVRGTVPGVSGLEYAEAERVALEGVTLTRRLNCGANWTRSAQGINLSRLVSGINQTALVHL